MCPALRKFAFVANLLACPPALSTRRLACLISRITTVGNSCCCLQRLTEPSCSGEWRLTYI